MYLVVVQYLFDGTRSMGGAFQTGEKAWPLAQDVCSLSYKEPVHLPDAANFCWCSAVAAKGQSFRLNTVTVYIFTGWRGVLQLQMSEIRDTWESLALCTI